MAATKEHKKTHNPHNHSGLHVTPVTILRLSVEEVQQIYAVSVVHQVVLMDGDKQIRVLSERVQIMDPTEFCNSKYANAKIGGKLGFAIARKHKQFPKLVCNAEAFKHLDTMSKPHWMHANKKRDEGDDANVHYAACSVCRGVNCGCPKGKGAPMSEHPHLQPEYEKSDCHCCLGNFE